MTQPHQQLSLLPDEGNSIKRTQRSGSFVDNMKLPVHRWFRYSAGFSAEWVESLLDDPKKGRPQCVFDPFAGSGTTLLACDKHNIESIGVEAHPFVCRIAGAKLLWDSSIETFDRFSKEVIRLSQELPDGNGNGNYPDLIHKCFLPEALKKLDGLKRAWLRLNDGSTASALTWLVLTAILRPSSHAGTAQWQYILPNKSKKAILDPLEAFSAQRYQMMSDMQYLQGRSSKSRSTLLQADARNLAEIPPESVDLIITSPPYANNYDYADATRFELSFWGQVRSWGDLHDAARKYLIRSSSQHAAKEKLKLEEVLAAPELEPIRAELTDVCEKLAKERLHHGGKKHYHTMIAAYFADMAKVWSELSRITRPAAMSCFVIGDSAPYGIYAPVDRWLGELAVAVGFKRYRFEKLRDRNIKWKNRTHRIPLHEGRLWVEK